MEIKLLNLLHQKKLNHLKASKLFGFWIEQFAGNP